MSRTVVAAVLVSLCSPAFAQRAGYGLPPCPAGTEKRLGSDEAKQCWLKAAHGGWRILERDGHYDSAVYHVGADDLQDAEAIAKALVAGDGSALGELLVYVYLEPVAKSSKIRRISWVKKAGRYEALDLTGRAPDWIVPTVP
jgi:hypothetical protein